MNIIKRARDIVWDNFTSRQYIMYLLRYFKQFAAISIALVRREPTAVPPQHWYSTDYATVVVQ